MSSFDQIVGNFHPNVIMRNMVYDAVENPAHACNLVGMAGITEDGDEAECRASVSRIEKLSPLIPMILASTEWMAKVITAVQVEDEDSGVIEEMTEDVQEAVQQVMRAGVVSVLSAFFEIGLIAYPEFK